VGKKKVAQRRHAKRRAAERYGLELNRHDMRTLVEQIQHGDAEFIERQSLRVSVWWVTVGGKRCRVVYDRLRKTIVTFLPEEPREHISPC
jgi:hypothetical protein